MKCELTINGRLIVTTPEHPFHVHGAGWIDAGALTEGMQLDSFDGPPVTVNSVRSSVDSIKVHNFTVAESHTYFVGEDTWGWSVWAHNTNYGPGSGWVWQWDWSGFGAGYVNNLNPWGANTQPPVDTFDHLLIGSQKGAIVTAGIAGGGAGGLGAGIALGVPGAAAIAGAEVTAVGVATTVATEVAEEAFEQITGVPVIVDPLDVVEAVGKGAAKKGIKEGVQQLTEQAAKNADTVEDLAKQAAKKLDDAPTNVVNTKEFQFADRTGFEDLPEYRSLKADIAKNGLKNKVIEYVEINGQKYVVRGNQRLEIAEDLGKADQLLFKKVELPFLGYRNEADVIEEAINIIHNRPRGIQ